ncbi:MAG: DUF4190 domain-containing protein [Dermatophilaceae bacterium]
MSQDPNSSGWPGSSPYGSDPTAPISGSSGYDPTAPDTGSSSSSSGTPWGAPPPPASSPPPVSPTQPYPQQPYAGGSPTPSYGQARPTDGPGYPPAYQGSYPQPAPAPYPAYGSLVSNEHPQGTTIMVLGILSLVVCGVLGPVAWVMGNKAIKEIDAAGGTASNRSQVNAGRICGIIASVLMVLVAVFYGVMIIGAIATGTGSTR